jgi:hypothetical protein
MNHPAASSGVSTASIRRHYGLDPESSLLKLFRTPAFAGVTTRDKMDLPRQAITILNSMPILAGKGK